MRDTAPAMSDESVELAHRTLEAAEAEDWRGMSELLHPECAWVSDPRGPDGGVIHGREQVLAHVSRQRGAFGEFTFEIHDIRDTSNGTLIIATAHGRGAVSGVDTKFLWCFLLEVRDGRVGRVQSFLDREEALEAAGVSE